MHRISVRPGERGVVLILFAISITMLLTVSALVLGSSVGYTAVRKAQNAADAAATAAAGTLDEVREGRATPAEVEATAVSVAEDNGATPGTVTCSIVTARYALERSAEEVLGPCSTAAVTSPLAAGVRVTAEDTRDIPFASFVDRQEMTATATAAATIQPIRYASFRTPFLVCATGTGHGTPLLVADPSASFGWRVNDAALGQQIVLTDNGNEMVERNCGSRSWFGIADPSIEGSIPSDDWWPADPGAKVGWFPRGLAGDGACDGDVRVGCKLLLPLCSAGRATNDGNGNSAGSNFELYCPAMGVFEVTYTDDSHGANPCGGHKPICARLTNEGAPLRGRGVAETPGLADPTRIRLVE